MVSGETSALVGDGGDGGPGVAALDEQLAGGLEDSAPGLLGLVGAQR